VIPICITALSCVSSFLINCADLGDMPFIFISGLFLVITFST
jgi:hypothetical protein